MLPVCDNEDLASLACGLSAFPRQREPGGRTDQQARTRSTSCTDRVQRRANGNALPCKVSLRSDTRCELYDFAGF
jgi:hypothetical protein